MRKELPRKILYENMFARPPINVLCRFRLICKTWDRLIIQPEFVSLSTHVPQRELWILITPMMWEFLTPQREMENVGKYWTWRSYSTATLAVLLSLIIAIDIALRLSCQWTIATQSYKIVAMKPYTKDKSMREEVCLYGSTSKEWRILCEVPGDCDHEHSVILAKMGVKKVAEMPKCMKCTIGMLNQPLHCG